MTDRFGPAFRLLTLAQELARRPHRGMTLTDMQEFTGTSRKTAERLRDALILLWPDIESEWDENNQKRWVLRTGEGLLGMQPTADELADLNLATDLMKKEGHSAIAGRLDSLTQKLEAATNRKVWKRIDPDLEFLNDNLQFVSRPGPYERIDPDIEQLLRQAMIGQQKVLLHYRPRTDSRSTRPLVCPYGFLVGKRHYLVAFSLQKTSLDFRLFALSNIDAIELQEDFFDRDPDFDLAEYASRSFGVYQSDKPDNIRLIFDANAARDARHYVFHPSQNLEELSDGRLRVTFHAGGFMELCWHLFTWGSSVTIEAPEQLKERYTAMLKEAQKATK